MIDTMAWNLEAYLLDFCLKSAPVSSAYYDNNVFAMGQIESL